MNHSKTSHRMLKFISNDNGVTLVEAMIYVAMAGMLLATAVTAFLAQNKSYNRQDVIAEIQQNIRGAMEPMVADIRFAGMGFPADGAFSDAEDDSLTVNYEIDDTPMKIGYSLTNGVLERQVNGGALEVLAENIEQLRFEYLYDSDPNKNVTWEWARDMAGIRDDLFEVGNTSFDDDALEQIRAVKIIMLGSARPAAFNPTDPGPYIPPLEGPDAGESWAVVPNSGYKRMMSTIVQCRNNQE